MKLQLCSAYENKTGFGQNIKYMLPIHFTKVLLYFNSLSMSSQQQLNNYLLCCLQLSIVSLSIGIYVHCITQENVLGTLFHSWRRNTCTLDCLSVAVKRRATLSGIIGVIM